MSRSGRVRVAEVRAAMRVVGECRDVGHDPGGWRRRAADGVGRLLGAKVTTASEWYWRQPDGEMRPFDVHQVGLSEDDIRRYFLPFYAQPKPGDEVLLPPLRGYADAHIVSTRMRDVPDDIWYRSRMYTEFHTPVGLDFCAVSVWDLPGDRVDSLGLHRDAADRNFSERELAVLKLFHEELGRLIGPVLVAADDAHSPTRLPPRVRQTLRYLLEGDSEKQIAARMGLSRPTVHQYVTALYRHYRVSSRAELFARVLRRRTEPPADGSPAA